MNTIAQDPMGNVSVGAGNITFVPGSYQCRITAPAFKVGNHHIEWETSAGTVCPTCKSAVAVSPQRYSVPTNAVLEVSFTISASTTYRVHHYCQFWTYPTPYYSTKETNDVNTQLGFSSAAAYTSQVVYATVACYRNG